MPDVVLEHKRDVRHVIGKTIGTLGVVSGRSRRPTGILPARLGPKIAFREGFPAARSGCFNRRISDLARFSRPARDRHAAPERPNRAG